MRLGPVRTDTIRAAVLRHLAETGLTRYAVAKAVRGRLHPSLVYRWLAGRGHVGTDAASEILAALGLSVTETPKPPPADRQQ